MHQRLCSRRSRYDLDMVDDASYDFAALVLIGCIPVGVDARYNAEGVFLAAKLGPIRLQLLPQKPKEKETAKTAKKPEKAPEKAASQEKAKSDPFRRRGRNFAAAGYCA